MKMPYDLYGRYSRPGQAKRLWKLPPQATQYNIEGPPGAGKLIGSNHAIILPKLIG